MTPDMQRRLRTMLDAKRAFDAAWRDMQMKRSEYLKAQESFMGMFPESNPPRPIICGDTFIKLVGDYRRADCDFKFEFTECDRCKTSE